MSFAQWLPFALASFVLVVIPGPTVLLVISYALGHGRRYTLATTAGVALGDFTSMTASMVGLGAMLTASAAWFTVLKWIGAAYLVYLGAKLWHAPVGDPNACHITETRAGKVFAHAYAVTTVNPKSIVFFVAFVPQFIDPHAPVWPQIMIFEATFVVLGTLNAFGYALLASGARRAIRSHSAQRAVNRLGGTTLICAGIVTTIWKTASA